MRVESLNLFTLCPLPFFQFKECSDFPVINQLLFILWYELLKGRITLLQGHRDYVWDAYDMTNLNILLFLNYNIYKTAVVVLNMSTTTEHSVLITRCDLVTELGHEFFKLRIFQCCCCKLVLLFHTCIFHCGVLFEFCITYWFSSLHFK